MRRLLAGADASIFENETIKQGIIEFYSNVNGFVFDKLSTCNCIAYLEVLKDTFIIMSKLGTLIIKRHRHESEAKNDEGPSPVELAQR